METVLDISGKRDGTLLIWNPATDYTDAGSSPFFCSKGTC